MTADTEKSDRQISVSKKDAPLLEEISGLADHLRKAKQWLSSYGGIDGPITAALLDELTTEIIRRGQRINELERSPHFYTDAQRDAAGDVLRKRLTLAQTRPYREFVDSIASALGMTREGI